MKPEFRLIPLLLGGLGILCGCQSSPLHQAASPVTAQQPIGANIQSTPWDGSYTVPNSLVGLNQLFLDSYKERLAFVKSNTSPLIVANFSTLVLYWNGVAQTNRSIPDICDVLKDVAHVPFGVYLLVERCTRTDNCLVPEGVLDHLKSYVEHIQAAERSLPNAGFSREQLARQVSILAQCKAYLTNIIAAGRTSRRELLGFTHKLGPLMLANADDAAVAQLNMAHAAVMRWKRQIPADQWKRLIVVVRGLQMPRRLNILTQYFGKVVGEPSHRLGYPLESRRLIYAEFISNNRDHLDLMATTIIDGDASEAFFGDRWRMSRDVLADGARAYLKQLKFD